MNRNLYSIAAYCVFILALVFLYMRSSATVRETERLAVETSHTGDSLARLEKVVDSLKQLAPGLGDYMTTIQFHASKLWFAAQTENWMLARYEKGEIEETMEGAEGLHMTKNKVDVTAVLRSVREAQLKALERAIDGRKLHDFNNAYDETLAACNGCHRPAGYEFIQIIRPTHEPVSNQQWRVGR